MIKIPISQKLKLAAEKQFPSWRSSQPEQRKYVGKLGEWAFDRQFPNAQPVPFPACCEYDRLVAGVRVDIKTSFHPYLSLESVVIVTPMKRPGEEKSRLQNCDYYLFLDVQEDYVGIIGWIAHDDFLVKADFVREGEKHPALPQMKRGMREDCYVLPYYKLNQVGQVRVPLNEGEAIFGP